MRCIYRSSGALPNPYAFCCDAALCCHAAVFPWPGFVFWKAVFWLRAAATVPRHPSVARRPCWYARGCLVRMSLQIAAVVSAWPSGSRTDLITSAIDWRFTWVGGGAFSCFNGSSLLHDAPFGDADAFSRDAVFVALSANRCLRLPPMACVSFATPWEKCGDSRDSRVS